MKSTFLKIIAFLFLTAGFFIIASLHLYTVDLTQGQKFIQYLPYWVLSLGFIFGGLGILLNIGYFNND